MRAWLPVGLSSLLAGSSVSAKVQDEEIERREAEIFGTPAPADAGEAEARPAEAGEREVEEADGAEDGEEALTPYEREVRRRESEIFGGGPPTPGLNGEAPASPIEAQIPQPTVGLDVIGELEDILDIGGRTYLALQYTFYDAEDPPGYPLVSPRLRDVYLDAPPSDRIRAYVEARLDYDFTVVPGSTSTFGFPRQQSQLRLDQLWLKLDAGRAAFFTLGKQRIRWGVGRFWNPTDFLNPQVRNPLDVFDRRLGVSLARVLFPLEALESGVTLVASFEDANSVGDTGLAARIEAAFLNSEISVSAAVQRNQPLRFGLDASGGLWLIDLRAEVAALFGSDQPVFLGPVDLERGVLPEVSTRADEWVLQTVLGGEISVPYSATDFFTAGTEYFYNQAGYDDAALYPLLFQLGAFQPLYLGRHYLAGYFVLPGPGRFDDTTLLISTIANLSDLSAITRVDLSTLVLTFVTVNVWAAAHYGSIGELHLGIDLPPTPGVPGLEEGVSVPPPVLDLGGALTVSF